MQQPARAQEYEGYWGNVSLRESGGAGGESPQALMSEMKSWRWDGDPRGPWRPGTQPWETAPCRANSSQVHTFPWASAPPQLVPSVHKQACP